MDSGEPGGDDGDYLIVGNHKVGKIIDHSGAVVTIKWLPTWKVWGLKLWWWILGSVARIIGRVKRDIICGCCSTVGRVRYCG